MTMPPDASGGHAPAAESGTSPLLAARTGTGPTGPGTTGPVGPSGSVGTAQAMPTGPGRGGAAAADRDDPEHAGTSGRRPWPLHWSARSVLLVVSGTTALALAAILALLPVPYVIFAPGPVRDTLGQTDDGVDLIVIEGAETYDTPGELALTTIRVFGGPLGEDVSARLVVAGFAGNPTAEDVVEEGDIVLGVDGTGVDNSSDLVNLLQTYSAGDEVAVELDRGGEALSEPVTLAESDTGSIILGVFLAPEYDLPYDITYDVGGIGGPSAGLIFALGIYDKLTPGSLTGGEQIAGTGTMADDGSVGPIDGVRQKLHGARSAGASWFLAPEGNCGDVAGQEPEGLDVIAVSTLIEAIEAVEAIGSGEGVAELPRC